MKIERSSQVGKTTVRLIGHLQAEHVGELSRQFQDDKAPLVLDLQELTVVDVEVVRFLGGCEASGMKIVRCPQYIREWINRERKA
jgi:anti-anti-sigma regulatory factor